jgi:ATP-dependent DNA helicase RecQ
MTAAIQLRPFQKEAIDLLCSSRNIHLALTAPTGAGKGVILERLAQTGERILLLTPLIALGRQQALRFQSRGVATRTSIGRKGGGSDEHELRSGVWISSPESILHPSNLDRVESWKPSLIAVDEAHCIHEWGDRFRPAYRALVDFVRSRSYERTLWMSATFPRETLDLLQNQIPGKWSVLGKFALPSRLIIQEKQVAFHERLELVRRAVIEKDSPGILFAGTRKNVGRYLSVLESDRKRFLPYHAGMSDEERRAVETRLQSKDQPPLPSVIATNAFGMGMDYSHLSWVVLSGAPFSLLAMMQALGRVARGGAVGSAEVFWAEEDFRMAGYLSASSGAGKKGDQELELLRTYLEADPEEKSRILTQVFL